MEKVTKTRRFVRESFATFRASSSLTNRKASSINLLTRCTSVADIKPFKWEVYSLSLREFHRRFSVSHRHRHDRRCVSQRCVFDRLRLAVSPRPIHCGSPRIGTRGLNREELLVPVYIYFIDLDIRLSRINTSDVEWNETRRSIHPRSTQPRNRRRVCSCFRFSFFTRSTRLLAREIARNNRGPLLLLLRFTSRIKERETEREREKERARVRPQRNVSNVISAIMFTHTYSSPLVSLSLSLSISLYLSLSLSLSVHVARTAKKALRAIPFSRIHNAARRLTRKLVPISSSRTGSRFSSVRKDPTIPYI